MTSLKRRLYPVFFLVIFAGLVLGAADGVGASTKLPVGLDRAIERTLYRIESHASGNGTFTAHNRQQRLKTTFRAGGVEISLRDEPVWTMHLLAFGRSGSMSPAPKATPYASHERIEYRRGALVEWYVNEPEGLEQGFTLYERPAGSTDLRVDLAVDGLRGTERGADLRFESGSVKLGYAKLFVVDAAGAVLPSRMELRDDEDRGAIVRISVDDAGAVYPIVIDPVITNDAKLTASDGPGGDFGIAVSISGDTALVGARNRAAAYLYRRDEGGPDNWGEVRKITGGSQFGFAVAIDGDTAVVGAMNDGATSGCQSGRADIFGRDQGGAEAWGLVANLEAQLAPGDDNCLRFGWSVAIDGDTAVVGAPGTGWWGSTSATPAASSAEGSVHVFERDEGGADTWGVVETLIASDQAGGDSFGYAVAIDGDTLVVGAPTEEEGTDATGSAYVYPRDPGTGDWLSAQEVKVTASDAAELDLFGSAVSVSGDTILIGAPNADVSAVGDAGAAYVRGRDVGGAGTWGEVTKLTSATPAGFEEFGVSVALDGDRALVGGRFDSGPSVDIGSAWLFGRNSGGADSWGELATFTSEDGAITNLFGRSVSLDGTTALVGAAFGSAAYVYDLSCGDGVVGAGETCDDGNVDDGDCCSSTCQIETAGTVCRGVADVCDVAETCDGVTASCPVDVFEADTTECRASTGACDPAEMCSGSAAACPGDVLEPATTECRTAAGACDSAEFCTGSGVDCPADAFEPNTTECRPAGDLCDVAEFCTGGAVDCPVDAFEPNTTECRGSNGICDVAESCTGSSAACPADSFEPDTTECRASNGVCDLAESCTGSSAACPADAKSTEECRPSADQCDAAEVCDGIGDTCPADAHEPDGTLCDDGDVDTVDDMCAAGLCMGEFAVCGNGLVETGEACDDGNTSDGDCCSASCQHEAAGSSCEDGIACTAGDTCDGAGACTTGGPATTCVAGWSKANLLVKERKPGFEVLKLKIKGGPAVAQGDFGNPESGSTAYDLCIFDDSGALAAGLSVDRAGDTCAGKPCWAAKKDTGWQYKDREAASDGVTKAKLFGGVAGKTQIQIQAANNEKKGLSSMPTGIAAALQGSAFATVQLFSTDGPCFDATIVDIKKQEADFFKGVTK